MRKVGAANTNAAGEDRARAKRGAARRDEEIAGTAVAGIVLAGTHSWGDCPLERVLPRPLAPVANFPLISHVLSWLSGNGVNRASVCGNSMTQVLRRHLANGHFPGAVPSGMRMDYFHDVAPRGPAGCVRDAGLHAESDTCVAVEGTIVPLIDLADLVETHRRTGASLTVVVSAGHGVKGVRDDSPTPTGLYVFSRRALERVPRAGYQDIKESLIPRLYQCGESVLTYRTSAATPRVTGVDSYLAVNEWAVSRATIDATMPARLSGYKKVGEARVHPEGSIAPTARLIGPVLIGPGSVIEKDVTIVGPTTIGANCRICSGAVICRCAVWDSAIAGAGSYLDRCIVTSHGVVEPESAHRYVVISETQPRFPWLGGRIKR